MYPFAHSECEPYAQRSDKQPHQFIGVPGIPFALPLCEYPSYETIQFIPLPVTFYRLSSFLYPALHEVERFKALKDLQIRTPPIRPEAIRVRYT